MAERGRNKGRNNQGRRKKEGIKGRKNQQGREEEGTAPHAHTHTNKEKA